jgi:hypothetical protein
VAEAEGFHEVEFFDQSFRLRPGEEYEWEMMEFASAAKGGADSDMLSGAAATLDFLRAVIHADDWERFRKAAKDNRAQVSPRPDAGRRCCVRAADRAPYFAVLRLLGWAEEHKGEVRGPAPPPRSSGGSRSLAVPTWR